MDLEYACWSFLDVLSIYNLSLDPFLYNLFYSIYNFTNYYFSIFGKYFCELFFGKYLFSDLTPF